MSGFLPPAEEREQKDHVDGAREGTLRRAELLGDVAPALVGHTDEVLFGQVWRRAQLSPKERSLVTVAALTASGKTDQLVHHLGLAEENGATEEELIEAIAHPAFYAGWPQAMAALAVAEQVFPND